MKVRLVFLRKRKRVWTAELSRAEATLGRGRGCTVRIPSGEVSRLHCRLRLEDERVTVEDLESANGTFVNGTRVQGRKIVRPGDRLSLGPVTFVVEYETTAAAQSRQHSDADVEVLEENDVELVEDADEPTTKAASSREEPVDILEEAEEAEELSILEDQEELQLPEGGDLRDLLIELDDSDEQAK